MRHFGRFSRAGHPALLCFSLLLALRDARVYDLDRTPVSTCRWTDVENVRAFAAFFREHAGEFPETP